MIPETLTWVDDVQPTIIHDPETGDRAEIREPGLTSAMYAVLAGLMEEPDVGECASCDAPVGYVLHEADDEPALNGWRWNWVTVVETREKVVLVCEECSPSTMYGADTMEPSRRDRLVSLGWDRTSALAGQKAGPDQIDPVLMEAIGGPLDSAFTLTGDGMNASASYADCDANEVRLRGIWHALHYVQRRLSGWDALPANNHLDALNWGGQTKRFQDDAADR